MIERWNAWFWWRVGSAAYVAPASLGIFRWFYGVYLLACEAPHFWWLGRAPQALYQPPSLSLAGLLQRFPPAPFFVVLDVLVIASLCCVTVGYRTRVFTTLLLVGKLVGANFQYSFGKIDHDIIMSALLACMLLADWGRCHSLDAWRGRTNASVGANVSTSVGANANASAGPAACDRAAARGMALFAVLLAFGMITAGFGKLLSWIDFNPETSGFLSWFYPNYYSLGRTLLLADSVRYLPPLLLEVADYTAPLLELAGFAALLWSRSTWLTWLLLVCSFHVTNALVLNIPFTAQAMTYLAFVDLSAVLGVSGPAGAERVQRWLRPGLVVVPALGLWQLAARALGKGSGIVFVSSYQDELKWALYLAVPVCLSILAFLALDLRARGRSTPLEP